ncbi:PREDICTED: kinesin-like protein KIF11-A [Nicrophorus vespilloides]|uniref:Kinesin-like protein KIF11-A n=1 Tax=Nicrophorus vespilloides TaxID=110193 RepID=A0ABM1M3P0_NICVS|nr:PREDICTED: kinesin-like protein KIF11-A [Nicrophorus vespilloides]
MTRLTVAIRVRPLSDRENITKSVSIVSVENGKTISVTNIKVPEQNAGDSRERVRRFTFDYCFDSISTQEDVFQNIGKEIGKAIKKRFHSCVLAYGQSSTGKTHTMIGDEDDVGLAPRLCETFFDYLAETAVGSETQNMSATVSYLEIYNEKVKDLLNVQCGRDDSVSLKVREHPKKGPYVQGLTERTVADTAELLTCLQIGNSNRRTASTNINPRSSRSHSVFTITCFGGVKLRLVDLAGSERAGSRSHTTPLFREGANINKSLVALRNVITALADKHLKSTRKRFIPYRDSILTWLLKDTLGGNSKTILISTISPSSACYSETVNTLRFGQTAKQIVVQPLFIEDPKERTIRELRTEIAKLKELLYFAQTQQQPASTQENRASEGDISWEEVDDFDNSTDSGITSSHASLNEDVDDDCKCETQNRINISVPIVKLCEVKRTVLKSVDKLIPVMEVTANISKPKPPVPLQRTYSVDHKMGVKSKKLFGSHEVLTSKDKKPIEVRKRSLDKPMSLVQKKTVAKSVLTEPRTKFEAKSKIDSLRRAQVKPRSEIVAAVTQRLYNKVKKKEASTDTDDIDKIEPVKELSICSNARLKLLELTRKALKAHRRRNEYTQTDLFPVLRVKEISTDVDDLQFDLSEIKDACIGTDPVDTQDFGVGCSLTSKKLIFTRTCGTSTENLLEEKQTVPQPNLISFTKYLQPQPEPKFEIIKPCIANPIYTSSVNINVNHNYINTNKPSSGNLSDDSLEEYPQPNVCLPTPDLISNHNSLEQSTSSNAIAKKSFNDLSFANMNVIQEEFELNENYSTDLKEMCVANFALVPRCSESIESVDLQTVYASQTFSSNINERCTPIREFHPNLCKANIVEDYLKESLIIEKPIILKSIMKQQESSDDESVHFENIPDSLNYYNEKKKVRFNEEPFKNENMVEAMTNFMKEVTTLMSNLTKVANRLENSSEQEYDVEVTVNDFNMPKCRSRRKKEHKEHRHCCSRESSVFSESTTQTSPIRTCEMGTTFEEQLPVNKYEAIVRESCERLEKVINKAETQEASLMDDLHRFPQPFSITTDWNCRSNAGEDLSLESNLAFSDYGSLPRRRYRRERFSSCSPSTYLKELTTMRKQIVESSREAFSSEPQ